MLNHVTAMLWLSHCRACDAGQCDLTAEWSTSTNQTREVCLRSVRHLPDLVEDDMISCHHMLVLISGQGCSDATEHLCHVTGHDGRVTHHMDHECNSFAWVLGIGVAGAEVKEVGPSSVCNGLA